MLTFYTCINLILLLSGNLLLLFEMKLKAISARQWAVCCIMSVNGTWVDGSVIES